jgi:hypothetical protein
MNPREIERRSGVQQRAQRRVGHFVDACRFVEGQVDEHDRQEGPRAAVRAGRVRSDAPEQGGGGQQDSAREPGGKVALAVQVQQALEAEHVVGAGEHLDEGHGGSDRRESRHTENQDRPEMPHTRGHPDRDRRRCGRQRKGVMRVAEAQNS